MIREILTRVILKLLAHFGPFKENLGKAYGNELEILNILYSGYYSRLLDIAHETVYRQVENVCSLVILQPAQA